jgi:hypothetical protein
MFPERTERDLAEDIGGEPLLSLLLLESFLPIRRGELEDAASWPTGQQTEQISEVTERLNAVKLATGEKRDEGGVH